MSRHPFVPCHDKNLRRKFPEDRLFFHPHSVFLHHSPRSHVLGMNQRDHAVQLKIAESMVAHCLGGFRGDAPVPKVRMQSIGNFDFLPLIDFLVEKTAVADEFSRLAPDDGKL